MYASYNSSSNPFSNHNLTNTVAFSSDKRSLNLNSLNNQLITSFIQQQQNATNTKSSSNAANGNEQGADGKQQQNQQQMPFIQGFPMGHQQMGVYPANYFPLGDNKF